MMRTIIFSLFGLICVFLVLAMSRDSKDLVANHKMMSDLREEAKTISSKEELDSFINKYQADPVSWSQGSLMTSLDKAWLRGYLYAKTQEYYKDDE